MIYITLSSYKTEINMFQRQFFPKKSQIGLCDEALRFNECLINHKFNICEKIISENAESDRLYWNRMQKRISHILERKKQYKIRGKKPPIYIYWHGFWSDMNTEDCQILDFLKESMKDEVLIRTNKAKKADIFICSCLGEEITSKRFDHCLKIIFLGENIRPYYRNYDLSLTSDLNEYRGRNINLPLWLLEIDLFNRNKKYDDRETQNIDLFCSTRSIDFSKRESGIVYIGNNEEPFRQSLIYDLSKEFKSFHTYGSQTNPIKDKINFLKKYKGSLAFENSFYPGYVTEKIIHTYLAGNMTIYWGCLEGSIIKKNPLFFEVNTTTDIKEIISKAEYIIKNNETIDIPPLFEKKIILKKKENIIKKLNFSLKQFSL